MNHFEKLRKSFLCMCALSLLQFGCSGIGTPIDSSSAEVTSRPGDSSDPGSADTETDVPVQLVEDPDLVIYHYPQGSGLADAEELIVYGDDFVAGAQVYIGGKECTTPVLEPVDLENVFQDEIYSNDATLKIRCTLPTGDQLGSNDVTVVQGDFFGTSPVNFTYETGEISLPGDLQKLRRNWARTYTLTQDIDFVDVEKQSPITYFYGTLDGGDFALQNLSIQAVDTGVSGFVSVLGGTIRNIHFENLSFEHTYSANTPGVQHSSGLIAGYGLSTAVVDSVQITNSQVSFVDPNDTFFSGSITLIQDGAQLSNITLNTGGNWNLSTTDDYVLCTGFSTGEVGAVIARGREIYIYDYASITPIEFNGTVFSNQGCGITPDSISF